MWLLILLFIIVSTQFSSTDSGVAASPQKVRVQKKRRGMSPVYTDAILLKLDVEGITVEGMEPEPDALERYFATPEGEQLLSRLIRQELEAFSRRDRNP